MFVMRKSVRPSAPLIKGGYLIEATAAFVLTELGDEFLYGK